MWGATRYRNWIDELYVVSIHAPVWGATLDKSMNVIVVAFQSTHPCGVRPPVIHEGLLFHRFNPRTRVGCDKFILLDYVNI